MLNPMTLEGKTIIVTGAGQGIGRAIATTVLELGGNVVAMDRNKETLDDFGKEAGLDRLVLAAGDVTDAGFVAETVDRAAERTGRVDGLVNNAGITRPGMIHKMERDDWDAVLEVNLTAPFLLLKAVGQKMLAAAKKGQPGGSIVNISSDAGRRGTIGQINYGAAKSGLNGVTMSAAREWAGQGIRVNAIAFGVVETPMTEVARGEKFREKYLAQIPMGRWGSPTEVAYPVCFLLSDAASYMTGQIISVNGGFHIAG